jgi:hypothetical protein
MRYLAWYGESHARIRYARALRAGLIPSQWNRLEPLVPPDGINLITCGDARVAQTRLAPGGRGFRLTIKGKALHRGQLVGERSPARRFGFAG